MRGKRKPSSHALEHVFVADFYSFFLSPDIVLESPFSFFNVSLGARSLAVSQFDSVQRLMTTLMLA